MTGVDEPDSAREARLLAELRQALGTDPPPDGLVERSEALVEVLGLDSALAELLDPAAAEPAGLRGVTAPTSLEFEVRDGSVALELALELGPERDRLVGQVLAGDVTEVALERPTGVIATATVDGLGRFSFAAVHSGPVRLRLAGDAGGPVTTDWFHI